MTEFHDRRDSKAAHVERAAINFRVHVRKTKKVSRDAAFDSIAETTRGNPRWKVSANEVLKAAKKMGESK